MKIVGFTHTSPQVVQQFLRDAQQTSSVLPLGYILQHKPKSDSLIILSMKDLKTNRRVLSQYSGIVIVFAALPELMCVRHIKLLDAKPKLALDSPPVYSSPNFDDIFKVEDTVLKFKTNRYLTDLIELARSGSILTHLMTFLYRITSTKQQNDYRDLIISWFVYGDGKLVTIKKVVDSLKQKELRLGLFTLIKENIHYHHVFQRLRKGKPVDLAKEKVNEFDINYMLSIADKANGLDRTKNPILADS